MMYKNNFVVVVKCNGRILRERNGVVFLPFGSEYSIFMKNMDARKALVSIEVDGQDALNGHKLIIDGNTNKEIKGFMRDMNKTNRFRFINKTKEIQNHRGDRIDDGLVRITYQFESNKKDDDWLWINDSVTTTGGPSWGSSDSSGGCFGAIGDSVVGDHSATYYCSSDSVTMSCAPHPDEGITVKGEKINQNYVHGSIGTLDPSISTIVLHLKGETKKRPIKKPLTVKTKISCATCGRKNRSTNKFCYNCGTYLS